jgi:ubiquitin-protein ligase
MSSIAQRRILSDIRKATADKSFKFICDDEGIFGAINTCYIAFDAIGTVYAGQLHILSLVFDPVRHPEVAPTVKFMTPIWHANVSEGGICLDILKGEWSSLYNISTIFISMLVFLQDPNPDSALNSAAARDYRKFKKGELDFSTTSTLYYNENIHKRTNLEPLIVKFNKMTC